jgi:peptidoglycan/LPS O-acetylase OafA/YrhL
MSQDVSIPKARFFKTHVEGANRNTGLDIARAICTIAVVFAHTNNFAGKYTGIYKVIFPVGYIAQDLFFCLSGFLVGHQILKYINRENIRLITFYKNRWTRTIPFYLIFLLINYTVYKLIYSHSGLTLFKNTSFSLAGYLSFTQNLYSPHPYFFPEIWPLPVEEWSFLLIPLPIVILTVFFKKALNFKQLLILLLTGMILVTFFRIKYVIHNEPEIDWELRKIVMYRLDALLYGFVIRLLTDRYSAFFTRYKTWFLLAGFTLAFGFCFSKPYLSACIYKSCFFSIVPLGTSLMLPWFYFCRFNKCPRYLKALLTHISLTSYAVLLCHLYLVQFTMLCIYTPKNLTDVLLFAFVYCAVVVIVSTLFFNYAERPVLLRRKKI